MRVFEIGGAILEGIVMIPVDTYYGVRRTAEDFGASGADVRRKNAEERDRVATMIADAVRNRRLIARTVEIAVSDFLDKLPEATQDQIRQSAQNSGVKFGSNKAAQITLSTYLGRKLTERIMAGVVAKRLAKFGVGALLSVVLLQGMMERASNASERLRMANPGLYRRLKQENLDMVYFLTEEELAPFVSTDVARLRSPRALEAFIERLEANLE